MHVSHQFKAESKKSENGRKTLEALEVMNEQNHDDQLIGWSWHGHLLTFVCSGERALGRKHSGGDGGADG